MRVLMRSVLIETFSSMVDVSSESTFDGRESPQPQILQDFASEQGLVTLASQVMCRFVGMKMLTECSASLLKETFLLLVPSFDRRHSHTPKGSDGC